MSDIVINSKIKGDLHVFLIDDINVRVSCLITEKKVQISKNVLFFKKTRQMYTYRVYLMISDNSYRISDQFVLNIITRKECIIEGELSPNFTSFKNAKFSYITNDQNLIDFINNFLNSSLNNQNDSHKSFQEASKELTIEQVLGMNLIYKSILKNQQ